MLGVKKRLIMWGVSLRWSGIRVWWWFRSAWIVDLGVCSPGGAAVDAIMYHDEGVCKRVRRMGQGVLYFCMELDNPNSSGRKTNSTDTFNQWQLNPGQMVGWRVIS